ncbi:hypothetical protein L1987_64526 [Smallanthus sonchifolius]|uniref:Uncharacterized protein n=1 Tax=Smallanthus sonchifolius TaxID=185202 RepID=A0ACB9BRV8_9ASTR|nr:hypothetical protein L1987_64526 [Smallanthus sonchifolius]
MRVCLWGLVISMWKPNYIRYVPTNGSLMGSGRNFVYYWPRRIVGYLMLMGQRNGREPMVLYGLGMCCNKTRVCFELIWDRLNRPIQFLLVLNVLGRSPNVNFRCFQSDYAARAGVRGARTSDKTRSDDESMEDDEPLDQPNSDEDEDFRVMGEKAHRYRLRSDKGVALKPYHRSNPSKKGKHHRKGSIIKDASFYKIDKENWLTNGLNESSRSISEINPSQLHGPMVEINVDTSGNNHSEDVSLDVNTVVMHGEDNTIIGENTTTRLHGSISMDREVNYNEVFLNKEDSGDSILDNLSKIHHCVNVPEGALLEEMEVNSACRDTLIHTTASNTTGDGIHLNCAVDTNIDMNLDNVMWSQSVSRASKECLSPENNELGKGWKELFTHLLSQQERLREIVANITTTDVNKALVNSILGMKQFKVLKFLAKMNADGKVTIDENMVEADQGPERDYGNGRQSGQGFKPNGSGYARMASNGNTIDKGNIGNFMYTRNIVNNQRAQENQGNTKHTEDREGMDKPDRKGQNPMATNGTSSKVDELLKTGDRGNREEAQKDKPTDMNEEPDKSKDAWKRKQERIVNAKFRTHTTQEERFEAKRYILDGLVPLDSTISEWSVYIIDYFRQLCNVFEFGEGLQVVSRERLNSWKTHGMEMDNDEEEVGSEVDGTANLMKTDGPASLDSNPKPTAGPNEFLANRMSLEDGIPSGAQNHRCV